eukprot:SAG22_NODE_21909_length_253_cov_0.649351_1_plen_49_part_01
MDTSKAMLYLPTAVEDGDATAHGRTTYTYNIPLVSAILNNSKYWPLIFT